MLRIVKGIQVRFRYFRMATIVQECVRGELGAQSDCRHPRFSITRFNAPVTRDLRTGECVGSFGVAGSLVLVAAAG